MKPITVNRERTGRNAYCIKTPIIRPGDDLKTIVIDSCVDAVGEIEDKAVIGVTESAAAIAQGNFVTAADIQADIARKYYGQSKLTILFPIQSRNRFLGIMQAIADMPQFEEIYVVLSYPSDEVGNSLISEEELFESGVKRDEDEFTSKEFYNLFGIPKHKATGKNYIWEFEKTNQQIVKVRLSNNLTSIATYCENVLVCTICKEQRELQKKIMKDCGAERVYDLSEILNESINGSGYNPKYGLYGSNKMDGGMLKLMPRDCQAFVESVKDTIRVKYGKNVEVMIYGDGAFKDPVTGIYEKADPETTLAATELLSGTPVEVKLKYVVSQYPNATQEELQKILAKEIAERNKTGNISAESSLGTTPRQITDLLASLMDLMSGSGDQQTPVVYVTGYLK